MTDYFLDDSIVGGLNDGSSWDNAWNAGTQVDWTNAATNATAAGDRIIVGSTNSTVLTSDLNFTANSNHTELDPLQIIVSTKAGSGTTITPVNLQSSGNGEISGNGSFHIAWTGNFYTQGFRAVNFDGILFITNGAALTMQNSHLGLDKVATSETYGLGNGSKLVAIDTVIDMSGNDHVFDLASDSSTIKMYGGSLSADSGITKIFNVLSGKSVLIEGFGVDLSNIDSTVDLVQSGTAESLNINFADSKLPATMFNLFGSTISNIPLSNRIQISGEQGEVFAQYKTGNVLPETTILRDGGASTGTAFSLKLESTSSAKRTVPLRHVLAVSNPGDLDTLTIKIHFAQNSGSPLDDSEIWIETYVQTSGGISSNNDRLLIGGTPTNHTDESGNVDWRDGVGALTGYNEQSCEVTISGVTTGILYIVICVAVDFTTTNNLYVDPLAVIS